MNKDKFYADGIRFECQGSGKCCKARGDYGYVYLTYGDRKRLARHLGIQPHEFMQLYAEKTDGLLHLKNPDKDCSFFKDNRCTAYDARPRQCRTWPFWPENMNEKTWEREVASFCPGVGRGKLYSCEEIEKILKDGMEIPGINQD